MKKIALTLYSIYGLLLFTVIMVILTPIIIIVSFFGRAGYVTGFYLVKTWAFLFAFFGLIRLKIVIHPEVIRNKSYIYVSNHTSFLDAIALPVAIPGTIRPLGKIELGKLPLVGLVIKRFGVLVDRKNPESRRKSLEEMIRVSTDGDNILIFPEGTMNRTSEPLQSFYDGAFKIATEARLDIVPVVIRGAGKLLPPSNFPLRPGKIEVEIGAPIPQEGKSLQELKETSRIWILEHL